MRINNKINQMILLNNYIKWKKMNKNFGKILINMKEELTKLIINNHYLVSKYNNMKIR